MGIMIKFEKILAPTDFSEGFRHAFDYSLELASMMKSELHIVHSIEPSVVPADLGFSQISMVDLEKELEKNARIELEKLENEISDKNVKYETAILIGRASDQIVGYAKEYCMDLICIATHGRSGFQHMLFGSTTEKVLRRASCPVLSVRMQ